MPFPTGVQFRAFLLSAMLAPSTALAQEEGDLLVEARESLTPDGEDFEFEVGTFYVAENREELMTRTIGIGFVRFRSLQQPPSGPPIFLLPGGPGGSYVRPLENAGLREQARMIGRFSQYMGGTDLVLVDQRGASARGDVLMATSPAASPPENRAATLEDSISWYREFTEQVVAEYQESDVDLRGYTVIECAHDVAELATALGYDQITLCGTSFGSQWSFAIMRLYPELVVRALLSGVEPLDHGYDMPSHVFAAVRRIWKTIDEDPSFAEFLPEGGMAAAAEAVIQRLEREPIQYQRAGDTSFLGPEDFPWRDPALILQLYHDDLTPWTSGAFGDGGVAGGPRTILGPLIDSSLGVTPKRRHQLWTDPAVRYLTRSNFALYLATAELWPSPDVGDDFRTPVECDIPVIFAQGDWDLSTPIENTYEIAPYFTRSRVLVAERGGHGVLEPIAAQLPEVWAEIENFLHTGDFDGIPSHVLLEPSVRPRTPMVDVTGEG